LAGLASHFAAKLPRCGRIYDEAERMSGHEDAAITIRAWIFGAADFLS